MLNFTSYQIAVFSCLSLDFFLIYLMMVRKSRVEDQNLMRRNNYLENHVSDFLKSCFPEQTQIQVSDLRLPVDQIWNLLANLKRLDKQKPWRSDELKRLCKDYVKVICLSGLSLFFAISLWVYYLRLPPGQFSLMTAFWALVILVGASIVVAYFVFVKDNIRLRDSFFPQ